jgi:RNA polymerase sigma factor (sigma-70 family)
MTHMESRTPRGSDRLSDESLLNGLAIGDQDAGLAFTRRFQGRVFGVAVTLLHDPALAEDVAQEAFVRAWRYAGAYDPRRGTVAAWLLRITRNLAIDTLRLRRPQPIDPDVLATLDLPSRGPAVDDVVITAGMAAEVAAAVREVPPEQARALLLAAFYGHTAEEISVSEGIPLGTAKTRIRLGLRKVRAILMDQDSAFELNR